MRTNPIARKAFKTYCRTKIDKTESTHYDSVVSNFIGYNKHNRLNVGRIALERLEGALINCSLLQSGGGEGA